MFPKQKYEHMDIDNLKKAFIDNLQDETMVNNIRSCESLSDFMKCFWTAPEQYYAQMGERLATTLKQFVNEDLLANYGILINPWHVPDSMLQEYVAIYTTPTKTIQNNDKIVNYFGNVKLDISNGTGHLYDSKYPAEAHGTVFLEAYNHARVNARQNSSVILHDYALCDSWESAFVCATDHSFVYSQSNNELMLSGGALGIIAKAPVNATLFDNCQLMVLKAEDSGKRVHVNLSDNASIYLAKEAQACDLELKHLYKGEIRNARYLDLTDNHLGAIMYMQHPDLAYRVTPEIKQDLIEHLGGRMPDWIKVADNARENTVEKAPARGIGR